MVCCLQACRPQTSWNLKVDDADSYLRHHQPIKTMSTSWPHPLWTITIKLLTILSKLGDTVFRGRSLPCPPLPGKVIKLSFSTSPKTLSPRIRFSSGVQRSWAFGINFAWRSIFIFCIYLYKYIYWEPLVYFDPSDSNPAPHDHSSLPSSFFLTFFLGNEKPGSHDLQYI